MFGVIGVPKLSAVVRSFHKISLLTRLRIKSWRNTSHMVAKTLSVPSRISRDIPRGSLAAESEFIALIYREVF